MKTFEDKVLPKTVDGELPISDNLAMVLEPKKCHDIRRSQGDI